MAYWNLDYVYIQLQLQLVIIKSFFVLLTFDIRLIALIARPVLGHISTEF